MSRLKKSNNEASYDYYAGNVRSNAIDIMLLNWPNVLRPNPSIYPRRFYYDKSREIISEFFNERGITPNFSAPQGLGAGAGEIVSAIYLFFIHHSGHIISLLKGMPLLYKLGKGLYKSVQIHNDKRYLAEYSKVSPTIIVDLTIKTKGIKNSIVYLVQLIYATLDLTKLLNASLPYVQFKYSLNLTELLENSENKYTRHSLCIEYGETINSKKINWLIKKMRMANFEKRPQITITEEKSYDYPINANRFLQLYIKLDSYFSRIKRKKWHPTK